MPCPPVLRQTHCHPNATLVLAAEFEHLRTRIAESQASNKRKDGEIERLKATLAKIAKIRPKEAAPKANAKASSKGESSPPSGNGKHMN